MLKKKEIGYFLRFTKVLAPEGEQYEVNTNLPPNATQADFRKAWDLLRTSPREIMVENNELKKKMDNAVQAESPLNREQRRALQNSAKH